MRAFANEAGIKDLVVLIAAPAGSIVGRRPVAP